MLRNGSADVCGWAISSSGIRIEFVLGFLLAVISAAGQGSSSLDALLARHRQNPRDPMVCERIGIAYTQSQDFASAAEYYRKALALDPGRFSAAKNLATVLWFSGRHHESEQMFETLLKRAPADPVPHLYLGLAAHSRGEYRRAAEEFERAGDLASDNPELQPVVAETYRMLAEAYDREKLPRKAYDAYRKAVALDTGEASLVALSRFAVAHANPAYAREALTRGLERHPSSPQLRFELGLTRALDGDFAGAQTEFDLAAALDPQWSLPVLARGVGQLQQGRSEEAAASFRRAVELAPGDYRGHYLLATALDRSGGRQDAARRRERIAELRRTLELNPKYAKGHAALAAACAESGERDAEARELEQARKLDPSDPGVLYRLSVLYRRAGRTAEADSTLQAFRRAKARAAAEQNELVQILITAQ